MTLGRHTRNVEMHRDAIKEVLPRVTAPFFERKAIGLLLCRVVCFGGEQVERRAHNCRKAGQVGLAVGEALEAQEHRMTATGRPRCLSAG